MLFSERFPSLGCIYVAIIAYAAIFTMIVITISNKAVTAAVSALLIFGLLIAAMACLTNWRADWRQDYR